MDPKQTKLNQQSEIWTHMGPARALEESVGPARALEEGEKFRKNVPLFFERTFTKNVVFDLQTTFFDSFNVLFNFLTEK